MESPKYVPSTSESLVNLEKELKDIRAFNTRRTMGYFPIDQLKKFSTIEKEEHVARERGYKSFLAPQAPVGSEGAFYVYDESALQSVLDDQHDVLQKYDWPMDAEGFVKRVSEAWIDDKGHADLRAVIERAFGRK